MSHCLLDYATAIVVLCIARIDLLECSCVMVLQMHRSVRDRKQSRDSGVRHSTRNSSSRNSSIGNSSSRNSSSSSRNSSIGNSSIGNSTAFW